ncbi:MAG: prephenate dehydrogenase [Eubacteriales bacterium]|nr:prephenate dehydrogenase [Eubacteriales bacterium]
MNFNKDTKVLIVGLGLIGGTYAEALSDKGYTVGAIDKRAESIDFALNKGWITEGRTENDSEFIAGFDLVIFALYPHIFLEWLSENQGALKPGTLLTDVTGVKSSVVYKVQDMLRGDLEFIGAHPMAGREMSGVEFANKEIFKGANYIVTPTEKNTEAAIETAEELGRVLGFKTISRLSPEEHDEMIGFLSQLTHVIAVALMVCKDSTKLADYTGDSFRDLTRIAKINDAMWSELFLLNKEELLKQIDIFSDKLEELRECIATDDAETMRAMMRLSKERRGFFDKPTK